MLSVVIAASDDAAALARLLTALVRGVAEELVGDVVVRNAAGAAREVADDAGATLCDSAGLAEAVRLARGDWVAGLPLTAILAGEWIQALAAHMERKPPASARLAAVGGWSLRRGPEGWLAPRSALSALATEQDFQRLTRAGGVRRLRILARD